MRVTRPEALYPRAMDHCDRPPAGWRCSRERGHDGPCPATPAPGATVEVRLIMSRELAEQLSTGWSEPVQIMVEQEQDGFWSMMARTPEVEQ